MIPPIALAVKPLSTHQERADFLREIFEPLYTKWFGLMRRVVEIVPNEGVYSQRRRCRPTC
jgi:hypothetical protein